MIKVKNITTNEFETILLESTKKNIICFCAGKGLLELCEVYPKLKEKMRYIVDNYSTNPYIDILGERIPVRKLDCVGEEIKENILVISSLKYANEMLEQIEKNEKWNQLEVYIPWLFKIDSKQCIPSFSKELVIPKKIHYCWFGHQDIPEKFKANIETWKKYCPEYEIIQWNESNYDVTKNQYMYQAYQEKKWGFVSDYARLDIIYEQGGIYLDTDVELLKSFDDLLQYNLFCGFESIEYVNFGLGFGAKKNHPILKSMLEEYKTIDFIKKDGTLNLVPCTVYQTNELEKYGLKKNGSMQVFDEFIVFPPECFAPINEYGMGKVTENTFSIHQYAATWFNESEKKQKEKIVENCKMLSTRMNLE